MGRIENNIAGEHRKAMHELLDLAVVYQNKTDCDVWFNFSGHVRMLEILISSNERPYDSKSNSAHKEIVRIYFEDWEDWKEKIQRAKKILKNWR